MSLASDRRKLFHSLHFPSLSLRVFPDAKGSMWKTSVKEIDGEILCVSQFTLMANTKGNKPDFHHAMVDILFRSPSDSLMNTQFQAAESSRQLYASFLETLRQSYKAERIKGNYSV